jgi:hypothetical protein
VRAFLGLAVAVLLLPGCGSTGRPAAPRRNHALDQSAARFAVRIQAQLRLGEFSKAWRSLHPAERRVVSVKRLASCHPKKEFPASVTFHATHVQDVQWNVPGTSGTVSAKEITLTATSPGQPRQRFTQHVVRRRGGWVWMLSQLYFRTASRGSC